MRICVISLICRDCSHVETVEIAEEAKLVDILAIADVAGGLCPKCEERRRLANIESEAEL